MNDKINTTFPPAYLAPAITVCEITVEQGFAGSGEVENYEDGGEF